jgi:hypothetical protein
MNDKLTYQQAKRLREQSLTSVLSDQLIMGEGYGSAIGKAISLKTKAKITGIKQKFDPLNIAKILTGGSRLGPAILGKMLGRSRKDIEFFAGRARPVTSRQKRIGALPGSGEDTTGLSVVLDDILTFLRKSHEKDMILREKENNLREGEKHDDERRHKKLLKALEKVGFGTASKVKSDKPGFFDGIFDSIKKFVQEMIDKAMQVFEWVKDLKPLLKLMGSNLLGLLLNPAFLAVAGFAALWFLLDNAAKNTANMKALDPTEAANILKNGSQKDIDAAGGREKLESLIKEGPANAQEILNRGDKKEILAAGGEEKLKATIATGQVAVPEARNTMADMAQSVTPRAIFAGQGLAKASKEAKWDEKFGAYYDPVTGKRKDLLTPASPTNTESKTTPVSTPPASAAVSSMSTENQNLNIQAASKSMTAPKTNTNVVNGGSGKAPPKPRAPIIAVRNTEPTFMQAIYNSTRIV